MENKEELNWEDISPAPDDPGELKKIKKSIRKRHWLTVLTSVVLVAVLIFGAIQYGIPALESRYWDPTESTYLEGIPDIELTMVTYNELFGMGQNILSIDVKKNGFANYTLDTIFLNWKTMHSHTSVTQRSASISKGESDFSELFWLNWKYGEFHHPKGYTNSVTASNKREIRRTLAQLPEYVEVLACISFPDYLTLDELLSITEQYPSTHTRFLWAALRSDDDLNNWPLCGVHLYQYQTDRYSPSTWDDTDYPGLFLNEEAFLNEANGSHMLEEHIKSMLRFSDAQVKNGTGILPGDVDESYYETTLAFMEENGVKAYGCYVIASPAYLLKMLDDGVAESIYLEDVWIAF